MREKRVTIKDVSAWANVSVATVSNYLNGTKGVSKTASTRIEQAIRELNYIPNANARSLKQQQTHVIGLIIPDMVMYSSICYYIENFLYENGYSVIICNTNFDHIKENTYIRSMMERRVDGLIVASSGQNTNLLQQLHNSGLPIVLFDRPQAGLDVNYVLEKHIECISKLTNHLLECGHRNIAFVKGPSSSSVSEARFQVFCEILSKNNIPLLEQYYFPNCFSEELCNQAFDTIFKHLSSITAVMVTNANQIKYLIMRANKKNISIPENLSFTGFGISEYKTLFSYPVTCIIQNYYDISLQVSKRILELIEAQKNNRATEVKTILVESEFFIGDSVRNLEIQR